jgi:hypothetical protein
VCNVNTHTGGRQAEREGATGSTLHLPILTARLELNIVVRAPIYRLPAARLRRRAIKILTHLWIDCCLGAHSHSHLCRWSIDGITHARFFALSLSLRLCVAAGAERRASACKIQTKRKTSRGARASFWGNATLVGVEDAGENDILFLPSHQSCAASGYAEFSFYFVFDKSLENTADCKLVML